MDESVVVRFGDWIGEGWRMFVEQWQAWVLNALIYFAILLVPIVPFVIVVIVLSGIGGMFAQSSMTYSTTTVTANNPDQSMAFLFGIFAVYAVAIIVIAVIGAYFSGGLYRSALKQLRGERIQVSDLFSGGRFFFRLVGANILIGILFAIGALLCVIPAFIVGGLFYFTGFIIVDQDLGTIDAMRASYELCKKNMLWFTLFAFVVGLIAQAGSYACYVGLLATFPLAFTIGAVAYRDCFDIPGMKIFRSESSGQAPAYGAAPPSFLPAQGSVPPPQGYAGFPPGAGNPPSTFQPPSGGIPPASGAPASWAPPPNPPLPPTEPVPPGAGVPPIEEVPTSAPVAQGSPEPPSPVVPASPISSAPQSNSCPSCRKPVAPNARFCTSCGTPMPGGG